MSHTCHAYRCTTACPPSMLFCGKHWAGVPRHIQKEVLDAFRPGQVHDKNPSAAWLLAATRARNAVGLREGTVDAAYAMRLEETYQKRLEAERAAQPAPDSAISHPVRYAQAALASACQEVAACTHGRNKLLNRKAYNLTAFAVDGSLEVEVLADELLAAALKAGLPENEARRAITNGIKAALPAHINLTSQPAAASSAPKPEPSAVPAKPRKQLELFGLSLYRPWPFAFVSGPEHLQKRVENRQWKPRPGVEWLALHAARKWDEDGRAYIERALGIPVPPDKEHPSGQIFAVCRLVDSFELEFPSDMPELAGPHITNWACGPVCWVIDDLVPLINPVPCKGDIGLWRVADRPGLLDQVRAAYTESVRARKTA